MALLQSQYSQRNIFCVLDLINQILNFVLSDLLFVPPCLHSQLTNELVLLPDILSKIPQLYKYYLQLPASGQFLQFLRIITHTPLHDLVVKTLPIHKDSIMLPSSKSSALRAHSPTDTSLASRRCSILSDSLEPTTSCYRSNSTSAGFRKKIRRHVRGDTGSGCANVMRLSFFEGALGEETSRRVRGGLATLFYF